MPGLISEGLLNRLCPRGDSGLNWDWAWLQLADMSAGAEQTALSAAPGESLVRLSRTRVQFPPSPPDRVNKVPPKKVGGTLFAPLLMPQFPSRRVANGRVRGTRQINLHVQESGAVRGGTAIDDPLVLQVKGLGPGIDQPWMPAAQSYQLLVSSQRRTAPGSEFGRRVGESRADCVVPAETILLDAEEGLFVAVIDGRYSRDGHEDRQRGDCPVGSHSAGDTGDIVVADESVRDEGTEKLVVAAQGMVQFEQVAVVDTGPDGLPQFVLGYGVDAGLGNERAVVTVQHLPEQPSIGMAGSHSLHHLGPELGGTE